MCPAGSWSDVRISSADNCTNCGVGMYATGLGATRAGVCTQCLGGTFSTTLRGAEVSPRSGGFREGFSVSSPAAEAAGGEFCVCFWVFVVWFFIVKAVKVIFSVEVVIFA